MLKFMVLISSAICAINVNYLPLEMNNWWVYQDTILRDSSVKKYSCYKVIEVVPSYSVYGDTIVTLGCYASNSMDSIDWHLQNNLFNSMSTYGFDSNYVYLKEDRNNKFTLMNNPQMDNQLIRKIDTISYCIAEAYGNNIRCPFDSLNLYGIFTLGGVHCLYIDGVGLINYLYYHSNDIYRRRNLVKCFNSDFISNEKRNSTVEICNLFPNPARNIIFVENVAMLGAIKIFDVNGRQVLSQKSESALVNKILLPKLSTGLYFVVFRTKESTKVQKILINAN